MKLRSIRQKFFIGVLLTSLSALLVAGGAMVFYDLRAYHAAQVRELRTLAELTGQATAVGLQFDDRKFAVDYLNLLHSHRKIDAAALYNAKGGLFASYVRQGSSHVQLPNLPDPDLVRISGRNLEVFRRIVENNEIIGTVYLTARYEVYESLWSYLGIVLGVGAFALGVSVLLSYWLQNRITGPILEVTEVARHVVEQRNFDARAAKTTDDEVGYLVDAFNDMLKEIARQTEALKASNLELEARIRERTEAVTALRSSERRNRALIDAMTSFVWTADPRRAFVDPQPAWSDYTGQPEEDYRGSGWRRAFHSDDKSRIEAHWSHAAAERAPFECEVRLWHAKSSSYRTVSVRAAPVSSQDNAISEWIGTIADIDDRHRAEDEIRRLNAELEERVRQRTVQLEDTNKELESFSYSVSHDLRAPLRAVDGYSQMLEEDYADRLDDEGKRLLKVVRSETVRMGRLIDDLLTFSRLGRKPLDAAAGVDMVALAREVAEELLREQPKDRCRLDIWPLPEARGDRMLLRQVWMNLLGNAIKYSSSRPKAEIAVTGEIADGHAVYRVADNGVGFDMKYAGKLFGVFQRLHGQNEFEGTGVGLAIVHRIITRHGGSVRATGTVGQGATFTFTLPARHDDEQL